MSAYCLNKTKRHDFLSQYDFDTIHSLSKGLISKSKLRHISYSIQSFRDIYIVNIWDPLCIMSGLQLGLTIHQLANNNDNNNNIEHLSYTFPNLLNVQWPEC